MFKLLRLQACISHDKSARVQYKVDRFDFGNGATLTQYRSTKWDFIKGLGIVLVKNVDSLVYPLNEGLTIST